MESNNDGEEGHSERGRGIDSFTLNLSEKRTDDTTPTVCAVVGSGADVDVGIVVGKVVRSQSAATYVF